MGKIRQFYDNDEEVCYPQTVSNAVIDIETGQDIGTEFKDVKDSCSEMRETLDENVLPNLPSFYETWTFTLEDGTTVTKKVGLWTSEQ